MTICIFLEHLVRFTYFNATNFRERVWKPFLEKIGITKRIRIHDLRRTYVYIALSSGLSSKFAQNQLGHAKNDTTIDWYTKIAKT